MDDFVLAPDSVFDDRFRILELIGEGGMGKVYKALDIELDRVVAVKLLNLTLLGDDDDTSRFKREGKILSEVQNENVVRFYSYAIVHGKLPYMVMEFVEGISLRKYINDVGRIPSRQAVEFAQQICAGLAAVHELGIVHRDLKPNNVLVVNQGNNVSLKLIDFGLSRVLSSSPVAITQNLTKTGILIGSVHYMSPEQCMGRKVDARADIYSLGCILYEMLCGELPFAADNPIALLSKHVSEQPRSLEQFTKNIVLPVGIVNVIAKAMAKDSNLRYTSAEELRRDLVLVDTGKGHTIAAPLSVERKSNTPVERRFSLSGRGALSNLLLAILFSGVALVLIAPAFQPDMQSRKKGSAASSGEESSLQNWMEKYDPREQHYEDLEKTKDSERHLNGVDKAIMRSATRNSHGDKFFGTVAGLFAKLNSDGQKVVVGVSIIVGDYAGEAVKGAVFAPEAFAIEPRRLTSTFPGQRVNCVRDPVSGATRLSAVSVDPIFADVFGSVERFIRDCLLGTAPSVIEQTLLTTTADKAKVLSIVSLYRGKILRNPLSGQLEEYLHEATTGPRNGFNRPLHRGYPAAFEVTGASAHEVRLVIHESQLFKNSRAYTKVVLRKQDGQMKIDSAVRYEDK